MIERIRELERIALGLDPGADERASLANAVLAHAEAFMRRLPDAPAYIGGEDEVERLAHPFGEEPEPLEPLLETLRVSVDTPGINCASSRHLGYIPGSGLWAAALGDFLAAVSNRYAGIAFASPGAVRLEKELVGWMRKLIGYPETAAGDLTSGGSIANLVGVVTARDAHELKAAEFSRAAVYSTEQVHHCVDKALRIGGLGECQRQRIPMDARYRMDAKALERTIERDRERGLIPWMIVASAGTTDTGSVDPLEEIAAIAKRHGAWLHVDAAYGGFFALTDYGRERLRGMAASDSIVMDPHKGLFLPFGCGAVLARDAMALHRAHYYEAHYMQDATAAQREMSPADLSPELSRHFRGLRLWLPLKLAGLAAVRAALEEKLLLARHFHERMQEMPGFELGPEPELSVVTYRYVPERGDADAFNQRLVDAVREDGRVFISSTRLDGKFVLRAAVLNLRTHLDQIELALDVLAHHTRRLEDN